MRKIRNSLENKTEDPMASFKKYIKTPSKKLHFTQIKMSQLKEVFKKMKKSSSASLDSITMRTLYNVRHSILPLILQLINIINKTSIFPDALKVARIIPIRKSYQISSLSMENFRPVCILSPISKIIEKFWVKNILQHMKTNNLIDENHQGGYPGRSSTTTVLELQQRIADIKRRKLIGAVVQLDQSGAYDVVSHSILGQKLAHIGLSESAVNTLLSYLNERKQYVRINASSSELLLTGNVSVGQGSVISGLLYGIFTLDQHCQMHEHRHKSSLEYVKCEKPSINTFVDDVFGLIVAKEKSKLIENISNFIYQLNKYYSNNELKNNAKKSSVMMITDDISLKNEPIYTIGITLKHKKSFKILGTIFSDDQKWNRHIQEGNSSLLAQLKKECLP